MLFQSREHLLLRGNVVRADGTAQDNYVYIVDGTIESMSRQRPEATQDLPVLQTGRDDWIFPGLLDLHSHPSYNILPIWNSSKAPYNNRFAWRSSKEYDDGIRAYDRYLKAPHGDDATKRTHKVERAVFAELQAIAGGVTVLQESYTLEEQAGVPDDLVLCRGTGNPLELGLPETSEILSLTDLFRPDSETGEPNAVSWAMEKYVRERADGHLFAMLVHLAEGRSGFGSKDGPDPYSAKEVAAFMAHPAFEDPGLVRQSPLSLIHACGINPYDRAQVQFLKDRDISVIWSPVSNLLLYGQTLDIAPLLDAGVNVALGSDWSPSGSKHVWDEAKFARFLFEALEIPVSDVHIFQMVTTRAARCLKTTGLGQLQVGAMADLFVIKAPFESDSPMEVFFKARDRDVQAVLVGGQPIYGDRTFLAQIDGISVQPLPAIEGEAVANKVVHLPSSIANEDGEPVRLERDIIHLEYMLKHPSAPMKPVKRSNLLASSDWPYRSRIADLRRQTIEYGQAIHRWRRGF